MPVLPVVPARNYFTVNGMRADASMDMEEVVGSIRTRSTNQIKMIFPNNQRGCWWRPSALEDGELAVNDKLSSEKPFGDGVSLLQKQQLADSTEFASCCFCEKWCLFSTHR